MATPKLKVGDTFVFTKEMWEASQKTYPENEIGNLWKITSIHEYWYGTNVLYHPNFPWIDEFLPEPKPRTLDDVKEGDELEELHSKKRRMVVTGRAGGFIALSPEDIPEGLYMMSLAQLKKDYKFADQPAERWKPKEGDKYYYIDVDGEVDFSTFDSGVGFKHRTIEIGNCFETAEEAEKAAEELKGWWGNRINNQKLK